MALSPQRLQQKRAKKAASRRKVLAHAHYSPPASINTRGQWIQGLSSPIYDVCINENLFESGMGTLVFCRRTAVMHHVVAMFLLDTYCLGVKNVVQSVMTPAQYSEIKPQLERSHGARFRPMAPSAARRLLEELVAWSRNLGFEPASEYASAVKILGETPPDTSDLSFAFGDEGKPFYISGPKDSVAKSKRIIEQLERKCGKDGFHCMVSPLDDF
jgi:hypothetical protein